MRRLVGATAGLMSILALASGGPAQAADAGMAGALDRIEAGTWSSADLAVIRSQPELAAQVPDPTDRGTVTQHVGTRMVDAPAVSALTNGNAGYSYTGANA